MPNYIINKQKTDGKYNEVHTTECSRLPSIYNRDRLGWHTDAIEAVNFAKVNGYPDADGCYWCSREANRG